MRKLPYPIQKLCLGEQERALDLITQGAQPTRSVTDDLTCDCPFFKNGSFLVPTCGYKKSS